MITLREPAPAKINLYLHVTGRRPDGYHLLDSLVAFTEAGDKLEISSSKKHTSLAIEGPFSESLDTVDNSIIHAAGALAKHTGRSAAASLTLHKNLPVAAGIGGGSADAGAALRLLKRFWKCEVNDRELNALALSLGADVPACLRSKTLYMGGIGEQLETGPVLSGMPVVLANPGKPLATAAVFKKFSGASFSKPMPHPAAFANLRACTDFLRKAHNDLEIPALAVMPEIKQVLSALEAGEGCLLARMSGSGATCFGIFSDAEAAKKAALLLNGRQPAWWVKATSLR